MQNGSCSFGASFKRSTKLNESPLITEFDKFKGAIYNGF